jgi:hypothetical protein
MQGIILYEQERFKHYIDPLEFEALRRSGKRMQGSCLFKDNWIKNFMKLNTSWKKLKRKRREQRRL